MLRLFKLSSLRLAGSNSRTWVDLRSPRLQRLMVHPPRGIGLVLTVALFAGTIVYGAKTGPIWPQLEATYGTPPDMAATIRLPAGSNLLSVNRPVFSS